MLGIGREVLVAAAELEELKDGIAVAFGSGAGGVRADELGEAALGELVGGVDARVGVGERDAEEVGRVEAEAFAGGFGTEDGAGGAVEHEDGFELGAGAGPLDEADLVAEVEALGEDGLAVFTAEFWRREETLEADVSGTGEVGLRGFVGSAEREDACTRGNLAQDAVGVFGKKLDAMLKFVGRAHKLDCRR
jgi:hypothetical protein